MNGLNLLQQYIKEQELTGVILISPINLHYFAGFTGTTGATGCLGVLTKGAIC